MIDISQQIRNKALTEEIDFLYLLEMLSSYKHPRDKVTKLLKEGFLVRVKKGIYVFGKPYQKRPFSLEILSNLIYGPSYISFETALSFYGLIPEKVTRTCAASLKKSKFFETPVGEFVYYKVKKESYPIGIQLASVDKNSHFFIASREKALFDYLSNLKSFSKEQDLLSYLTEGMRIEIKELKSFDKTILSKLKQENQNGYLLWKSLKS